MKKKLDKMQRRQGFQRLLVLTGILLTLWAGRMLAQPATGQKASASGSAADGPKTVIPADLYVDDDNAGVQDGSALHPYRTVQQAINAAKGNAVIAVAEGTYPQNIRVQEKTVRLYGGYKGGTAAGYVAGTAGNFTVRDPAANPAHLKGNGKDSVVTLYEAGASIVDGFLITGGGRSSVTVPSWIGGGVLYLPGRADDREQRHREKPDVSSRQARPGRARWRHLLHRRNPIDPE